MLTTETGTAVHMRHRHVTVAETAMKELEDKGS